MSESRTPAPSNPYKALLETCVAGGVSRANQSFLQTLLMTFLAGAYIALGGFLAVRCGLGLSWDQWGSMGKFVFAAVFPLGLILTVICGADLFTGNAMTLTSARINNRVDWLAVLRSWTFAWLGNFIGALFVAYFLVWATGIIFEKVPTAAGVAAMPWAEGLVKLANGKTSLSFGEAFWRGVGCNWLVCLAVYLSYAAKDIAGKILALWFPTMAFVAMGMEHCIANMFFIPAAIFAGSDPRYVELVNTGAAVPLTADWSKFFIDNLPAVTLGNIVGGAVLVAVIYCLIHGKLRNS